MAPTQTEEFSVRADATTKNAINLHQAKWLITRLTVADDLNMFGVTDTDRREIIAKIDALITSVANACADEIPGDNHG